MTQGPYIMFSCRAMMCMLLLISNYTGRSQHASDSVYNVVPEVKIAAGRQYLTSPFHQRLWGKHYRKEWATPVRLPVTLLDTLKGGLTPYEASMAGKRKLLRLRSITGNEYVLRSMDKNSEKAIPPIYRNTFIEDIVEDQVSATHPYAALTTAPMAKAANLEHPESSIIYLPQQSALKEFNAGFGNGMYILEEKSASQNPGDENVPLSTEALFEQLKQDHSGKVDQELFLKARLFDMLVGDWRRNETQWHWIKSTTENGTVYKPLVPNHDQAYSKFDGSLLRVGLSAAGLGHLESFGPDIKELPDFNFLARHLDRRLLNELSLQQWQATAGELQQELTDAVIEQAVQQLPKEVYALSGKALIQHLKERRNKLQDFAKKYYRFLSKEVEITGSKQQEYFEITRLDDKETRIAIYDKATRQSNPLYSRTFNAEETKELRLYGLAGSDYYHIVGNAADGIRVRIVGGTDKDSIIDASAMPRRKTVIYDNPGNVIHSPAKVHLSKDTAINAYRYDAVQYNKKKIAPIIFFSNADRLYAGFNYTLEKHRWRQASPASKHRLGVRYSLTQNAFNLLYNGQVNEFIGKWNLSLIAQYDFIRWTNFYGAGNETKELTDNRDYYRMRSRDGYAAIGLNRDFGDHHNMGVNGFLQTIKILDDSDRFLASHYLLSDKSKYEQNNFSGVNAYYRFQYLDDLVMPTKGINASAFVMYTQNLKEPHRTVTNYEGRFNFYLPLSKRLVVAVRNGAATLSGEPEFYQLNSIGGTNTLRGFRRDRFWGEKTFYNANELQWHFNIRSRLYNGKFALLGLFDNGRVWQKGEVSNTWHTAYGGGIMLAPFNKGMITVTLAKSKENLMIHFGYGLALDRRD